MKKYSVVFLFLLPFLTQAQTSPIIVNLWPKGAPGFEKLRNVPEKAQDYWVKSINNPSIAVYLPPKEKANGTAVLICPGGGHRLLVYTAEGVEPAQYLNSLGVTAIVLKYRLAREEGSPYSLDKAPKEDAYRAMRTIRSKAKEWGIDASRIGMMGFSAGGEVVDMIAFAPGKGDPQAADPIEKQDGKPNFIMQVYPGPLGVPETIPSDAPKAFLVVANEDSCCSVPVVSLLNRYRAAKVPVEAHIYMNGAHAFNMGHHTKFVTLRNWPERMKDWLEDEGLLKGGN